MLLGCIADDFTGASDLALMLTREGLRTLLLTGLPEENIDSADAQAIVVALKSRTIPAAEAVAQSLAAADKLAKAGARRFFFKYCSTFDSTEHGNIGPVAEALMDRLGIDFTIACPAFPATGRSIYMGHLFVNGTPLAESGMRDHPLTPMRDSDLRRVLQRQSKSSVGHVSYSDVERGAEAIGQALAREAATGRRIAIIDALHDRHLRSIGAASAGLALVTGGSGIAMGLPAAYRDAGLIAELAAPQSVMTAPPGRNAVLAGSCSKATRAQVQRAIASGLPAFQLDPMAVAQNAVARDTVLTWIDRQSETATPLIYSSDDPEKVSAVQERLGREKIGRAIEDLLADIAQTLVARGFTRLLVAGGETSGAVVRRLGIKALAIGPEIDPGIPWTRSAEPDVVLALKSGNFGSDDFFLKAWRSLR